MKNNQLRWGTILSYVGMAISIIMSLTYTPIMIKLLGQSEYGLYNTVVSTISMVSILNLGFSASYVRYYSRYNNENNQNAIAKLNGLFLILFTIIGLIAILCCGFLTCNLRLIFDNGLTENEYRVAGVLMILLSINLAISFPMSVFSSIITAHEKFVFHKIMGIVRSLVSPLLTLPLLLYGYRSIAMVSVTCCVSILIDILFVFYVFKVLKQKFVFHDFEKGIIRSLFSYTVFIAINMIVDQINWNIDKVLLGRYRGTIAVSVYSVGYTLYVHYMNFSTSISNVFTPRIHSICVKNVSNKQKLRAELTDIFVKVGRLQYLLLLLIASGVVFFGQKFLSIWIGAGYEESYYVAITLIISSSIALIQNLGIEIQRAQNKHQFRSYTYLAMAIINLFLSIILCQLYGAIGSAVGTAISLIVANGLVMNIYYHKRCNIDIVVFWKNIMSLSIGGIVPIIAGVIIIVLIPMNNVFIFGMSILVYIGVYGISMYYLGMNSYEKILVTELLRIKRIKRK